MVARPRTSRRRVASLLPRGNVGLRGAAPRGVARRGSSRGPAAHRVVESWIPAFEALTVARYDAWAFEWAAALTRLRPERCERRFFLEESVDKANRVVPCAIAWEAIRPLFPRLLLELLPKPVRRVSTRSSSRRSSRRRSTCPTVGLVFVPAPVMKDGERRVARSIVFRGLGPSARRDVASGPPAGCPARSGTRQAAGATERGPSSLSLLWERTISSRSTSSISTSRRRRWKPSLPDRVAQHRARHRSDGQARAQDDEGRPDRAFVHCRREDVVEGGAGLLSQEEVGGGAVVSALARQAVSDVVQAQGGAPEDQPAHRQREERSQEIGDDRATTGELVQQVRISARAGTRWSTPRSAFAAKGRHRARLRKPCGRKAGDASRSHSSRSRQMRCSICR